MFDIGFLELALIGVVTLLVVGPERLPGLARTAGMWVGRARRFVSGVKADIDREIAADELKKVLAKQANSESLYDIVEETRQSISGSQGSVKKSGESGSGDAVTHKSNDADG